MNAWPNNKCLLWVLTLTSLVNVCVTARADPILSERAFDQLSFQVQKYLDDQHKIARDQDNFFPGATAAFILQDGQPARFKTGDADIELKRPMPIEARMPTGSIGKMYVAAVILSLVADGSLKLDQTIDNWLADEAWFDRLPNKHSITLRHLLNHSSGLMDHVFDRPKAFSDFLQTRLHAAGSHSVIRPAELVALVLDREPLFAAGQGFHYSDTGYILLGLIIEKVSAGNYYDILSERILKPLALSDTSPLNHRNPEGLVPGYAIKGQQQLGFPFQVTDADGLVFDPMVEWTGGGLISTSSDLVRWAAALFGGKLLAPAQLHDMLNPIAITSDTKTDAGQGYGLGVGISSSRHGRVYRHGGFFPGYNSMLVYFPDHGMAVAMQINTDQSRIEQYVDSIAGLVIDAITATRTNKPAD